MELPLTLYVGCGSLSNHPMAERLTSILKEEIALSQEAISDGAEAVNNVVDAIIQELKNYTYFKIVGKGRLNRGSYYEKLKVSRPDEFDVMITMGYPGLSIRPCKDRRYAGISLNSETFKQKFYNTIIAISNERAVSKYASKIEVKPPGRGPNIEINITIDDKKYSVDLVPSIMVDFPSASVPEIHLPKYISMCADPELIKDEVTKDCALVPKNSIETPGTWLWSFTTQEKWLIKNAFHGHLRDSIRIVKHVREQLEKKGVVKKLCSYHIKTAALNYLEDSVFQVNDRRARREATLDEEFKYFVQYFVEALKNRYLRHHFVTGQNILCEKVGVEEARNVAYILQRLLKILEQETDNESAQSRARRPVMTSWRSAQGPRRSNAYGPYNIHQNRGWHVNDNSYCGVISRQVTTQRSQIAWIPAILDQLVLELKRNLNPLSVWN